MLGPPLGLFLVLIRGHNLTSDLSFIPHFIWSSKGKKAYIKSNFSLFQSRPLWAERQIQYQIKDIPRWYKNHYITRPTRPVHEQDSWQRPPLKKLWCKTFKCDQHPCQCWHRHQSYNNNSLGPVVQSNVSLTSPLRGQLVKCFMTS